MRQQNFRICMCSFILKLFNLSYRRKYCNLVVGIDTGIGKILKALKENGMLENTVILYSSDNGGVPFAGAFNYPFR